MKKLIILIVLLAMSGCTQLKEVGQDYNQEDSKFGTKNISDGVFSNIVLICDSELGVEYLFIKGGYGAGLTVRYNALGTPQECDY